MPEAESGGTGPARRLATRESEIGSRINIICSDEARNGKTLFARLVADQLALGDEDRLRVFDTAHPRGDLARWFPRRSRIIDLTQIQGQVALFDTMIAEPRNNYVVDLQAEHLDRFFRIFGDIAFDEAAREAGTEVTVHFVLDRSMSSIQAARHTRSRLKASRFVVVLNEAIGNLLNLASAREHYNRITKDGEIVLPRLSSAAREHIEQPGFSFAAFIAGRSEQSPAQVRYELWRMLEILYDQRSTA